MSIIRNADNLVLTVPDRVVNDYVEQGWQDLSAPVEESEPEQKTRRSRKKTED